MMQMCSNHTNLIIISHLRVHSHRIITKCSVVRKITISLLNKQTSLVCVAVTGGISGKEPHQMHKTSCPSRFQRSYSHCSISSPNLGPGTTSWLSCQGLRSSSGCCKGCSGCCWKRIMSSFSFCSAFLLHLGWLHSWIQHSIFLPQHPLSNTHTLQRLSAANANTSLREVC